MAVSSTPVLPQTPKLGLVQIANADAEALVGAEVSPVLENVADRHHAPGLVATRSQALLIQATGDQAYAEAVLQIEAEDVADDRALDVVDLEEHAVLRAGPVVAAVAIGRGPALVLAGARPRLDCHITERHAPLHREATDS